MAAEDYGHNPVTVIDPTVRGLNQRCLTCGACDCHTSYLMTMRCSEVVASAHRIYLHPIPASKEQRKIMDDMPTLNPWNDPTPTQAKLDELDLITIRKAALECSARVARLGEIASDVIRRAEDFAEWIQKGETS